MIPPYHTSAARKASLCESKVNLLRKWMQYADPFTNIRSKVYMMRPVQGHVTRVLYQIHAKRNLKNVFFMRLLLNPCAPMGSELSKLLVVVCSVSVLRFPMRGQLQPRTICSDSCPALHSMQITTPIVRPPNSTSRSRSGCGRTFRILAGSEQQSFSRNYLLMFSELMPLL